MILPISTTFDIEIEESNGEWTNNYLINTFEYAIFIIPLILFLIIIPRLKNQTKKRSLIIVSVFIMVFLFWFAIQAVSLSIQGFIPNWGILLLLIFFPIVIIDSFMEWK